MNLIRKIVDKLPPPQFFAVTGFMFAFDAFLYGRWNDYRITMLEFKSKTRNTKRKHDIDALGKVVKRIQEQNN